MKSFKLALLQMEVLGGQKELNLSKAAAFIDEAAKNGANLLLLPEAMDVGWTEPACKRLAEPIPTGRPFRLLSRKAKQHGVYLASGLTERQGKRVYNSAVLIDPNGQLLLKHRKLNELSIAHKFYSLGDRLGVADTELGRIGLMICADGFAKGQVIGRTLGYMGADLILSPGAWAVPGNHDNKREPYGQLWLDNYIPVAKDFQLTIAAVSNVGLIRGGPWKGRNCIGCSMVINHLGKAILRGPYGSGAEKILYQKIELKKRPARGTGWAG